MANSTFNGPVRSENGFKTIDINSSTGAVTDGLVINADGNIFTDDGGHIQYVAASGFGPADLIVGKGGSQYATANPYAESATQLFPLGSKLIYGNNTYRYVGIGGTAVTAGKLLQQPAVVSDHANMSATAAVAAGETAISVETGGTDITLNQYANGYLWVNDVAGEGQMLRVKSNPAHDHSADPSIVITCYDALATALTTNSQLTLLADPSNDLIVAPAAETGALMGATVIDMTADYYGWAVISGPAALLTVGTLVVGNAAVRSGGTAGGVAPATDNVLMEVGDVMAVSANTEYSLINMNLS
jgi:hypothetical protein|tara:strand:- start:999 stop:1904 length:906 start_codon:yes stop_codon:yes gene_type:complete